MIVIIDANDDAVIAFSSFVVVPAVASVVVFVTGFTDGGIDVGDNDWEWTVVIVGDVTSNAMIIIGHRPFR